jgi:8-oxo-dGTP pyrophosphatase MutT (NUDIX family)
MPSNWRTIGSRDIVSDRWLKLRADTCELSDGIMVSPYYVVESEDWVNIIPLTSDLNVLHVRQYRHGIGKIVSEFPCGSCEPSDASPADSIVRELKEETGYTVQELVPLGGCHVNPARFSNQVFSFIGFGAGLTGAPSPETTEQLQLELRPLREVCHELWRGACLLQAMHMVTLFRTIDWLRLHRPEIARGLVE